MLDRGSRRSGDGFEFVLEAFEPRTLLSAAFDAVGLTQLRSIPAYSSVDGSGIGIAVLDTGIYSTHPDLAPNYVAWYDAVRRTGANEPNDPDGHGTHVAGTAAARDPSIGVATRAGIIAVRALTADFESYPRHDPLEEALRWVLNNHQQYNIRVVNMSLGTESNVNTMVSSSGEAQLIRQLEQAGITVVSASGNSYADYAAPGVSTPAAYSSLSVASTWEDNGVGDRFPFYGSGWNYDVWELDAARDRLAASSQRSALPNQVAAPGQTIYSTWNGSGGSLYNTIYGTSMASPLVAGAVALMQDAAKTFGGRYLAVPEVVQIIRDTADIVVDSNVSTNGRTDWWTGIDYDLPESGLAMRRINVLNAVQRVVQILTGSAIPDVVLGDNDNTLGRSIALGSTDGSSPLLFDGYVGADGAVVAGVNDVDLFRFETRSRGAVSISLAAVAGGAAVNPYLRLFDSSGAELASNDDFTGGGLYSRIVSAVLEPGIYYVGVSSSGNTSYRPADGGNASGGVSEGDYRLSVSLNNPDPNGVVTGAVGVGTLPQVFTGEIGSDSGVGVGPADVDFFRFVASDTGLLRIDTDTTAYGLNGVDTVLRVFNADFVQIAFSDDESDLVLDSYLEIAVRKGDVLYIAVADYANRDFDPLDPYVRSDEGTGGLYDLILDLDNGDRNGTVATAVSSPLGQTVSGSISSDFGQVIGHDGTKDVDFFVYTPGSDGVLDLRAMSPDGSLRPALALWVYDPELDDVVRVAQSSGIGEQAILARVRSGRTYYVSLTGLGNSDFDWFAAGTGTGGDTGEYQLTAALRAGGFARQYNDDSLQNGTPGRVRVGEPVAASIGVDGAFVSGAEDVDLYLFRPTVDQRVVVRTITAQADSADTVLRLFDAQGRQLAFNDDESEGTTGSRIVYTFRAGKTYYIGVNGFSEDSRRYNPINGTNAVEGDRGAYVLALTPDAAPDVAVQGKAGREIAKGDKTPAPRDGTNFGKVRVDLLKAKSFRTFKIVNTGERVLKLGTRKLARVTITGADADAFQVMGKIAATIAPGASKTFRVRFDPERLGRHDATVVINTNDLDEAVYTFAIRGVGR